MGSFRAATLEGFLSMNDPIAVIIFQVLKQAEERKFVFPLWLTVEAADGKQQVYEFPVKGQTPALIVSTLDPDTGIFRSPLTLVTRDSNHQEFHARVTVEAESEGAVRITMELEEEDENTASLFQRRPSTKDLIAELDEKSFFHGVVMLVVGFENTTGWVKSNDPQRLKLLNDAVRAGGNPIGLIAADMEDGHLKVSRKIFPENAERVEQCEAYFDRLTAELEELLKAEIEKRSSGPEQI